MPPPIGILHDKHWTPFTWIGSVYSMSLVMLLSVPQDIKMTLQRPRRMEVSLLKQVRLIRSIWMCLQSPKRRLALQDQKVFSGLHSHVVFLIRCQDELNTVVKVSMSWVSARHPRALVWSWFLRRTSQVQWSAMWKQTGFLDYLLPSATVLFTWSNWYQKYCFILWLFLWQLKT